MSEPPEEITLRVARYRPEQESAPTYEDYQVPLHDNWAVLDGLNHVKDQLDGTLSYRWSCRMGICGSCGMTVNGDPVLTCATFLVDLAPGPVTIEPLRNFPVIRDLVIEMTDFMHKLGRVTPWIVPDQAAPPAGVHGENLQTPEQLDDYHQYSMCINCMLCYSACPVYGLDPSFVGPAALALAQRYNLDSRDAGEEGRLTVLTEPDGIWGCTFVGECTKACPKDVDPAGAIQRYKVTAATDSLKSLLPWSGGGDG